MIYFVGGERLFEDGLNYATMEDVVTYCKDKKELGVDTETQGFFDFSNKIIMLQIGDKQKQFVIDVRVTDISPLSKIFSTDKITKIFWNAKFDYKFLKFHGFEINNIYDGMLSEIIITNGISKQYALDYACQKYCGISLDKSVRANFHQLGARPFTLSEIEYGANDVINLIDIKREQERLLRETDQTIVPRLENKFNKVLSEIEYKGFYLNTEKWKNLDCNNKLEKEKAKDKLDQYVFNNNHTRFINSQLDLFSTDLTCSVNWDSPKQVIEYLQFLGVDTTVVDKKTGLAKDTCEDSHISKFAKDFDFIPMYLDYKKWAKSVSTYGLDFLNNVNKHTGRIHSSYWPIVSTGRMSSNNPNLQNIPSDEAFRECFEGEGDNMLVVADYSGQEQKIIADQCLDKSLVDFHLNGDGDMHCLVTRKIFPEVSNLSTKEIKSNHSDKRGFAKTIGFAMNYGGSEHTIADRLQIPIDEAKKLVDAYFEGFPEMTKHFEKVTAETMENGYILIDDVTKRKFFIKDFHELKALEKKFTKEFWLEYRKNKDKYKQEVRHYFKTKGKIQRWSQNMPVQGTAGSMTKTAAIYLYDSLTENNLHQYIQIVNIVHDEIVLEVNPDYTKVASHIITESMEKAGRLFCKTIPLTADACVTKYWKH